VNAVQRKGARLLLGISHLDQSNTEPPQCAALTEANLKPAHVLRIMGLLRFWRIVLSRDEASILRQVWDVVDSHSHIAAHSLNGEIHRLQDKYQEQLGDTVPHPDEKQAWKKLVNDIAKHELHDWCATQQRTAGRVAAYAAIRGDLNSSDTPEYLTHPRVTKHERRNIACMRTQCTSYVAAHAQHRDTKMFGQRKAYNERYCQCQSCKHTNVLDSTAHVMLHCTEHTAARNAMIAEVDTALDAVATRRGRQHMRTLNAFGSDTLKLQLLLGSPPYECFQNGCLEYGQILAASAIFIQAVHHARWENRPSGR
jgi:hypothetical protein